MERRFNIPRRTQSAPIPAVHSEQASERQVAMDDPGRDQPSDEQSARARTLQAPDPTINLSPDIDQEEVQLRFPNKPSMLEEPQQEAAPELPIEQFPTAIHLTALPTTPEKSAPARNPAHKQETQSSDPAGKHSSGTEPGAPLHKIGQHVPADEKPQQKRPAPRASALVKRTFVPDQHTPPDAVYNASSPVDTPRPRPRIPKSDLPAETLPIVDQSTALLGSVHAAFPAMPSVSQSEFSRDQTTLAEQETALLGAIQRPSPPLPQQERAGKASELSPEQASLAAQPTQAFAALSDSPTMILERLKSSFIRHVLNTGLTRLQEPQPEGLLTRGFRALQLDARLGLVPALAVSNAFGLLLVSISYSLSVLEYSYLGIEVCFLCGLLLMFIPNLARLLSRSASRLERICLLCVLGFATYLLQFTSSPLQFSSFDDFLHWRTADDILRTGHLFSVNSMLPVSPYYPGLEVVTNAISTTTGLSTLYAGMIIINVAHLLMIVSLFLLYEQLTSSSRMAGIAALIYMTNSHFIFFDTIYNYETLALPLALFLLYILTRFMNADKNYRWVIATAWIVLLAIIITHHMTSYFFSGLLLLWASISLFRPVPRRTRVYLWSMAVSGLLLALAYAFLLPGNPVWSYLSQYFGSSFAQLEQIINGTMRTRPLFTNTTLSSPIWDRLLMTGSVALVTFMLPFGLITLQRRYRSNALALTFGIAALAYPFTQAFRFTTFGTEITDRATAFLFLPIAYVLTVFITHFWPTRRLTKRALAFISSIIVVIFLGGIILAIGPGLSGLPGPYLVGADGRSIEPEGINAALWSLDYLGPDNRIATDRTNQMLMSTYGDQRVLTRLNDNIDIAPIFYSAQFDHDDIVLLQYGQIHYLIVDLRLSTSLPVVGIYFENDRPTSIISRNALTKFNTVAQIDRLFDSGNIVIYNTGVFASGAGP